MWRELVSKKDARFENYEQHENRNVHAIPVFASQNKTSVQMLPQLADRAPGRRKSVGDVRQWQKVIPRFVGERGKHRIVQRAKYRIRVMV